MAQALSDCNFIVTQNSSVAFHAILFKKPAILFGAIDFHHICINVNREGLDKAFDAVETRTLDFEKYLYWYWHLNAINLESNDVSQQLYDRFMELGWTL